MSTILIIDGDPLMFRAAYNKNSVEEALASWAERLDDLKNASFCDEYKIAVYSNNNYRKDFYVDYKNTEGRKKAKANNPYFFELRDALVESGQVVVADGMEADDLVRIWSEEEKAKGNLTIIASVDKDLQCIPGHHMLIHRDNELIHVDEEFADVHYWKQVLTGDMVDNIRGLHGIGPKKAEKILEGATTSEERCQKVVDKYYEVYGEDWREKVVHTGTLIHILRSHDDNFTDMLTCEPTELQEADLPPWELDDE